MSRLVRRLAIYASLIVAAVILAYLATRQTRGRTRDVAHRHGVTLAGEIGAVDRLTPATAERIGVTYALATIGPLTKEVRTVGQVTSDETRVQSVGLKVDGWVERLHVNYTGQPVRRGDPLLSIYSPMLITAQEELLLAKRLQGDVSGGTSDAVRAATDLLAAARRRLRYWDIPEHEVERVERTGQVRRTLTLVSPVSGFVVEKSVLTGQKVMAGDALYRVADLRVVWIEGEVFEQDLAAVQVGLGAVAEFEAFPGERWQGRIAYVYPTLNAETRTARVRVELANRDLRLKPGMYATFVIRGIGRTEVLSVPRSAVLSTGERSLVFVKRADGALEPRAVTVGVATADRVEVRTGLSPGDIVVASATFLIDAESNLRSALTGMDKGRSPESLATPGPQERPNTSPPEHSRHKE